VTLLAHAQAWLRLAHRALANQHIAELTVQIARQRRQHAFLSAHFSILSIERPCTACQGGAGLLQEWE
jgi:hypothetical protein